MCGIAGIISANPSLVSPDRLKKMTDAIAHRGPEGEAIWINPSQTAGLGHRRLSIIDISPAAAQPMHYLQRYTIVHNGEIYNYLELRSDLQKKGYTFHTFSDTEVILSAFDYYGKECLQHFDGMFAFAIWDELEQQLFCARDRFGEKPFYFLYDQEHQGLYFASEMKALYAAGIRQNINNSLLLLYLASGLSSDTKNLSGTFDGVIKKLPASHFLIFKPSAESLEVTRYWNLNKDSLIEIRDNNAVEQFQELFTTSVSRRLRSDVSLGASLSGGLDSSSIVAQIRKSNPGLNQFKTFSAIFPGFEKDESSFINKITSCLKLENYRITPTADEFIKDFETLLYHQEEPISSASVYAQYKVFALAKEHSVTVLLDGQGADEILAGYTKYLHWHIQEILNKGKFSAAKKERLALWDNSLPFEWGWRNYLAALFPQLAANQLEKREIESLKKNNELEEDFIKAYFDQELIYKPPVKKLNDILYFNTIQSGLEELLRYADRNSMAHGREVRLPYLYHELVTFMFSLPSQFKINNGWTKWILRKAMDKELPKEILWRNDKIGFEPPQKKWMENPGMVEYQHEAVKKLVALKIIKPVALNKKKQPQNAYAADNYDWRYLVAGTLLSL